MSFYANSALGNAVPSPAMAMNTSGDSIRMLIIFEYCLTAATVKSQYDKVISRTIPYSVSSGLTRSIINTTQFVVSI